MSASVTARGMCEAAYSLGRRAAVSLFMVAACMAFQAGQTPSVATGPQLVHDGKLEQALEVFRRGVEASPKSVAANNGAGVVLDLLGRYTEARQYFSQAIKAAPTP